MGEKAKGRPCKGIEGIISEGQELLKEEVPAPVLDAAVIAAAQKVEHNEIAAYGAVRTYAQQLGFEDHARLLQQTLDEERETDKKLTRLAESRVNLEAEEGVE